MPDNGRGLGDFYDLAWSEWDDMARFSPAPRIRRRLLLNWMQALKLESLLDVGCGNGLFLAEARQRLAPKRLVGVDLSPQVIESNRRALPGIEFAVLDLERDTRDERFDAVVCMELLEHCADPQGALARLAAMTGQWLLLSVPCGPVFEIDRRVGHHRHFSAEEISEMVRREGLEVMRLREWGFPFFNLYKHLINLWPDRMCQTFLSSQGYGPGQKLFSLFLYRLFWLNLPWAGYQLLLMARRP